MDKRPSVDSNCLIDVSTSQVESMTYALILLHYIKSHEKSLNSEYPSQRGYRHGI